MTRAQPTTNKRHRKRFVEKDRALELASSIVVAQEQRLQAKAEKLQGVRTSSKESKVGSRKQSSKSRLKETMAKLEAQNKMKKHRLRAEATDVKTESTGKRVAFAYE